MRCSEQPPAGLLVEQEESKGTEVGKSLVGRPVCVWHRPQAPSMGRLLFPDKWTMQKGLGGQVGGQGDKRIQIQILRFLRHYSGQDLESKSSTVRAYDSFLCEEQGPYKLTAQVQKHRQRHCKAWTQILPTKSTSHITRMSQTCVTPSGHLGAEGATPG